MEDKNIVYHYCSIEALYGIVNSKSFWLTSLQSSNDKEELKISRIILNDVIREFIEKENDEEKKKIYIELSNSTQDSWFKNIRKDIKHYGLSCVKVKDSLIHWDRYGNKEEGVCIAINMDILVNYFNERWGDTYRSWIEYGKVDYENNGQTMNIKQMLINSLEGFNIFEKGLDKIPPHQLAVIYYNVLNCSKPFCKHNGFKAEEEYRICFDEKDGELFAKYFNDMYKLHNIDVFQKKSNDIREALKELHLRYEDKKYGVFGGLIRGYYALYLSSIWSDALIPEIVLGPKCYQRKNELMDFLRSNGLKKTSISFSKIPIR